jgi:hypothetical protein
MPCLLTLSGDGILDALKSLKPLRVTFLSLYHFRVNMLVAYWVLEKPVNPGIVEFPHAESDFNPVSLYH